jgi:phosphonate ABC transporter binding protein
MLTRRTLIIGSALALTAAGARAQDWRSKYPELVFAIVPAENASGTVDRWTPFVDYLSKELGTKVTLRVANDYAAVIEGQRAGNIHIAYYGPASFARARIIGVKTDAFAIDVNSDGSKGYYSVFYVLAKSPYQKIEDLKGKAMAFVDPNSTSGNNMPRFVLDRMGIDPDQFFSKTVFAGSHENAVLALAHDRRRRRQLVERARRFQPDPHAEQGHAEERGRLADDQGRLPHHPEVRHHHQLALCLSFGPARRPQGGDRQGFPRSGDQGQGGL